MTMIPMNVNDDASVARGVATVLESVGRLDAVVNNAGVAVIGAVEDTSIEEAKAQLETNFFGVLRVCPRHCRHCDNNDPAPSSTSARWPA